MDTSRGAVWRKWDLHVHTPLTQMNNAYGDESVWDSFIEHLENSDVDVIGITDYNTPVNYFEFLRRLKINHPQSRKTYFFNLELRLEVSVNKAAEEVNIHVIFDNKIPDFEKKINKFLTRLETSGSKGGAVVAYSDLGPGEHVGAAASSYRQITDELVKAFGKSHPYVVIGASNNAGLRPDTKSKRKRITTDSIDQECDGFFGNPEGREYFLNKGRYDDSNEAALSKPVFGGSDAHSMDDLKNWLGKQFAVAGTNKVITSKFITWIKADPSFEGLRQVFNEPKTRVYLGELPPKLRVIDENKTDYIESVNVYDRTGTGKKWFDSSIPLNPGLVAIIGKKGSGKSALTDIIAHAGRHNSAQSNLSFLTKERFLSEEVAGNFDVDINWLGGEKRTYSLTDPVNGAVELERVKYLPQKFVEELCNDFGVSGLFQSEINRVIFSYVPQESKLNSSTLEDLIEIKGEAIDAEVTGLVNQLSVLNKTISNLERKSQPEYIQKLDEQIEKKKGEITSLTKPVSVPKPPKTDKKDHDRVEELNKSIDDLQADITKYTTELSRVNAKLQKFTNIRQRLNAYRDGIVQLSIDLKDDASDVGIKVEDFITIEVKTEELDLKQKPWADRKNTLDLMLGNIDYPAAVEGEKQQESLEAQKEKLTNERKIINDKLSEPEKKYQKYQEDSKHYQELVDAIQGAKEDPLEGTINYLLADKEYITNSLPNELTQAYEDRYKFAEQIYEKKVSKTEFFEEIYQPVVDLLEKEKASQEEADSVLEFTVQPVFDKEKFVNSFNQMINFSKKGHFMGKDEGSLAIKDILRKYDIGSFKGIQAMLEEVSQLMRLNADGKPISVSSQLLKPTEAFYDSLFDMSYVDVQFNLQFNGKDLSQNQFSPGEKGALLLIFYLLIEKSNVPLIIDQPEENLDNESVFKLLVPYIRNVSEHRQVIIVTHNPNLAVVCDADQIIHAEMDKKTNKINYVYGSLEQKSINKRVADVLEGTLPAFDIRNSKYARIF